MSLQEASSVWFIRCSVLREYTTPYTNQGIICFLWSWVKTFMIQESPNCWGEKTLVILSDWESRKIIDVQETEVGWEPMSIFTGWFHESMKFRRILMDGLELEANLRETSITRWPRSMGNKGHHLLALYCLDVLIQQYLHSSDRFGKGKPSWWCILNGSFSLHPEMDESPIWESSLQTP